jgi:hypothetical protein
LISRWLECHANRDTSAIWSVSQGLCSSAKRRSRATFSDFAWLPSGFGGGRRLARGKVPAKHSTPPGLAIPPLLTPMFEIAFALLVAALLLVIIGICQPLAARLKVPPPVLLGAIGIALGAPPAILSQLGWSGQVADFTDIFANLPISSATYIYVFLPLLVFEAGVPTRNYIRQ